MMLGEPYEFVNSRGWRRSAADRRHRPRRLDEARLADVVLELLAPHGIADDPLELRVVRSSAQRRAEVGFTQREQARPQPPVRREADSVAVGAEWLRDGIDEADSAVAVGKAVNPSGRARLARLWLEREHRMDRSADLGAGQNL